jgi:hypothetical protein
MQLTVESTTNKFTIYLDYPKKISNISLLGAVINFSSETSSAYIYCDKIDPENRLYNGKRDTLLAVICKRAANQLVFDSKQKIKIPLSRTEARSLTFEITDKNKRRLNISSVVLELDIE